MKILPNPPLLKEGTKGKGGKKSHPHPDPILF